LGRTGRAVAASSTAGQHHGQSKHTGPGDTQGPNLLRIRDRLRLSSSVGLPATPRKTWSVSIRPSPSTRAAAVRGSLSPVTGATARRGTRPAAPRCPMDELRLAAGMVRHGLRALGGLLGAGSVGADQLRRDGLIRGTMARMAEHYQRPGWFTTNVFNRVVAALTRLGVSVYGSRVLEVKGRKSGEWRQTPVNLLRYQGAEYLVAPRGHTQWVKNLRASGQGRLRVGRRRQPFSAVELADDDKPPLLRVYLKKWKFEVGVFFGGVGPDSSDQMRTYAGSRKIIRFSA
jgi:deazaflavin-dependent oxidoreductase (nitroreductase family)